MYWVGREEDSSMVLPGLLKENGRLHCLSDLSPIYVEFMFGSMSTHHVPSWVLGIPDACSHFTLTPTLFISMLG